MKVDVIMPKMGESLNEGTIIKWHKKIGDKVIKDEILFDIATDKVDTEIPSPAEGILCEIRVQENQTVAINTVVAVIDSEAENRSQAADESTEAAFHSPSVRRIIMQENITQTELNNVAGSGKGGRITKSDLEHFLLKRQKITEPETIDDTLLEMDKMRLKIMENMIKSRDTAVHVTGLVEVDMHNIYHIMKNRGEYYQDKEKIRLTYTSFVAYAAVKALAAFPLVNSALAGKQIRQNKIINLGIAVALENDGLIVPNIKDAGSLSFSGLARAISQMARRARNNELKYEDIQGGTFSLSNYGVFGTLIGTPIINQPESAILGMGTVTKRAVVIEGASDDSIAIRPMMYLTLSHDHRLIDGMLGGKFLKCMKEFLEEFEEKII